MDKKIVFIDIDGTLVAHGRPTATEAVCAAVNAVQQKGIPVALASGRGRFAMQPGHVGVRADYYVAVNGSHITDSAGAILYEDRFTLAQVEALDSFRKAHDCSLNFTFEDGYYMYNNYAQAKADYVGTTGDYNHDTVKDGEDGKRHLKSLPFGAFICITDAEAEAYNRSGTDLQFVRFSSGYYDIYKRGGGKAEAIEKLLRRIRLSWRDAAAIGDGMNDVDMLRRAGLGVAMGNAPDEVKAAADRVTLPAEQDGVAAVLRDIFRLL